MILSIELMMEMGSRAQPDGQRWNRDTSRLAREAAQQAGYCLDAPDLIPTGRVLWCGEDDYLAGPEIEMIEREAQ